MQPDMTVVQGDRLPALQLLLQDADGNPIDVSNADSVKFRIQPSDRGRQAIVSDADVLNGRVGLVQHAWQVTETALPGLLLVNVVATLGGLAQTFPADRYVVVQVIPVLA